MAVLPGHVFPQIFLAAAVAGIFAGLLAVERKGAFQFMLARPLVLAPLLGAALGDVEAGLELGIPLELLTLGGVSLGASIPDNETVLAATLTGLVVPAGLIVGHGFDAPLAALGLFVAAPSGLLGRWLERFAETRNVRLVDQAEEGLEAGKLRATRRNLRGLLWPFATAALLCGLAVLLSPLLAGVRRACPPRLESGLEASWHLVWALSAGAAVRAIRDPRAPLLSAIAAAAVGAAAVLSRTLS